MRSFSAYYLVLLEKLTSTQARQKMTLKLMNEPNGDENIERKKSTLRQRKKCIVNFRLICH